MRCHNCGAEIPQGEWFCPACGHEVPPSDEYVAAEAAAAAAMAEIEAGENVSVAPVHLATSQAPAPGAVDADATQFAEPDATLLAGSGEPTVLIDGAPTQLMAEGEPTQLVPPAGQTVAVAAGQATVAQPAHAPDAGQTVVADPPTMVAPAPIAAVESPAQQPYVPQPEPRPRRGVPQGLLIGLAIAAVLAIAGIFVWQAYSSEMWGGKTLPDVVGKNVEEAQATLSEAGFASDVEDQYVDEGAGTVLRMDPEAGHRIPTSTRVSLVVGRQRIIPEVVGLSLEEARSQLERMGVTNIRVEYRNSSADEGSVLEVDPGVGSTVTATDEVVLVVSQPFTVPDVVGRTEGEAIEAIEAAGLRASVSYVESDLRAGTVIAVTPQPGTKIGEGVTVELQVAKSGPEDLFDIAAIYAMPPAEIVSFLKEQDFKLDVGYLGGDGSAFESLSRRDGVTYTFTPEPYSHHIGQWDFRDPVDVMSSGSAWKQSIIAQISGSVCISYVPSPSSAARIAPHAS